MVWAPPWAVRGTMAEKLTKILSVIPSLLAQGSPCGFGFGDFNYQYYKGNRSPPVRKSENDDTVWEWAHFQHSDRIRRNPNESERVRNQRNGVGVVTHSLFRPIRKESEIAKWHGRGCVFLCWPASLHAKCLRGVAFSLFGSCPKESERVRHQRKP